MNDDPMVLPTVLFWILAPLTASAPIRWSVPLYLLLVQIDLSSLGNFSTTSLGVENIIKVIIIPTILLMRIREQIHLNGWARKIAVFWAAFVAYACLTMAWSPYRTSAVKMAGYFYAYSVLFVVFTVAWQHDWLGSRTLMAIAWISLLGAVVQTYLFGNAFGSDVEFGVWRFTTFSGAQSFAPFLLCIVVLLLFRERLSVFTFLTSLAASAAILETGSRSIFLGLLWVLLVYGIFSATRSAQRIRLGMIFKRALWFAAAVAVILTVVVQFLPDNRLNEMVTAAVEKNATVDDVGTFGWRFSLYQRTLEEVTHRSPMRLLLGSGTSSGADLVLDAGFFQEANVDPNRAIHDEFLRAVYEWGVLGLCAFLLFFGSVVKFGFTTLRDYRSPQAWAFLAISVPLLISLTVENFLADSGSPGGVGYNLILTSLVAASGLSLETSSPSYSPADPEAIPGLSGSLAILPESYEGNG
jgi:O-antigen ligase